MMESSTPLVGDDPLEEMRRDADHARRRYDLYKARTYGSRPSSATRLAALQRESERAASRLSRAIAGA
jgi:hypothetical protein